MKCAIVHVSILIVLSSVMSPAGALAAKHASTRPDSVVDVRDFGATGDGKTVDTAAINAAIDSVASAGGGTVRFSAGTYLSVSIRLRSNLTLDLEPGATIVAAPESNGVSYDPPEQNGADASQDFGHSHWHNSLIWGEGLENVSIVGSGTIWGKELVRGHKHPDDPADKSIALKFCRNVILRDITIKHGGHFAILASGVDNLTIDNLKIDTNRDGIDLDCCRSVRISNCSVNAPFDDGICLKSSYALKLLRATENVAITNCQLTGYDEGTFLDGTYKRDDEKTKRVGPVSRIKLGTESNGAFRNIAISNCVFDYCADWHWKPSTAPSWKTSPSRTSPCATQPTARSSCAGAPDARPQRRWRCRSTSAGEYQPYQLFQRRPDLWLHHHRNSRSRC